MTKTVTPSKSSFNDSAVYNDKVMLKEHLRETILRLKGSYESWVLALAIGLPVASDHNFLTRKTKRLLKIPLEVALIPKGWD